MALIVEIQEPLSTSWTDITRYVADSSLELERTAWSDDYGHAPDLLRVRVRHDADSNLGEVLLDADRRIPVRVRDGATLLFRGAVMPTLRQAVGEAVGDIELEMVDQSWRLDRDCTSFAYQGFRVFDPSNTAQSIIHQRLLATGFTATEIDSTVSVTATVAHVARSAGDQTELDLIADLLKEYGYAINFRSDGVFSVRPWRRTSVSAAKTFRSWTASGIAEGGAYIRTAMTIERRELRYEAVQIEWWEVEAGSNFLVWRENIPTNRDGEYTGIVILPDLYHPGGGAQRAVWQAFRTEWLDRDEDSDSALLAVTNPSLEWRADADIEVVTELYEPLRARVVFHNAGSDNDQRLYEFDIHGDVVFRRTRRYSTAELRGRAGFAQGGTATTIILDADASSVDDYYVGLDVTVEGVSRRITDYEGASRTATVDTAWTDPDGAPSTPAVGARYRISSGARSIEQVKADYIFDSVTAAEYAVGLRDAAEYGRLRFQFRVAAADAVDPGTIVRISTDAPPIDVLAVVLRRRQILGSPDHPLVDLEAVGIGPLRRDDALDGDAVMSVVPAALLQQIDQSKLSAEEAIEGFDRAGGTTTPEAPVLQAWPEGRSVRLTWDRQYLLTNLDHYALQVSQDGTNWYSLQNDGDDWQDQAGNTTRHDAEEYRHVAIPLDGTADHPRSRTLHYRVRRVTRAGTNGAWSVVVTATAHALTTGDLASSIISAAKIDPAGFLRGVDEGLVAYWSLDDGASNQAITAMADNTGNGQDLDIHGTPTNVVGISGLALNFPGAQTDDYLERSPFDGLSGGTLSISLWLRRDAAGVGTLLEYDDSSDTDVLRIALSSTGKVEVVPGAQAAKSSATVVTDNAWHHLVLVLDSTAGSWWVDGRLDSSFTLTALNVATGGTLVLGGRTPQQSADALDGDLDEVRLYDRALTEAEIKFLYMQPAGPQPGMILGSRIIAETIDARHIVADAFNVLVGKVQDELHIGDRGWMAGGKQAPPVSGDQRGYLDRDEVALERHDGSGWKKIARLLAGDGDGAATDGRTGALILYDRENDRIVQVIAGRAILLGADPSALGTGDRRLILSENEVKLQWYAGAAGWNNRGALLGHGEIQTRRHDPARPKRAGYFRVRSHDGTNIAYFGSGSNNGRVIYIGLEYANALEIRDGDLRPYAHNSQDLGSAGKSWRHLYVDGNIGQASGPARYVEKAHVKEIDSYNKPLALSHGVMPTSTMHTTFARTYNQMYDWLSPALPTNGDIVLLSGGTSGGFGSGRDHIFSCAERSSSSVIYGRILDYSGARNAGTISYRNGQSANAYGSVSAAW